MSSIEELTEDVAVATSFRSTLLGRVGVVTIHIDPLLEDCTPEWIRVSSCVYLVSPSVAAGFRKRAEEGAITIES